jgi:sugar lactone lactonase YvrE
MPHRFRLLATTLALALIPAALLAQNNSLLVAPHTAPGSSTANNDNPVLTFSVPESGALTRLDDLQACILRDPSYAAFNARGELFVANRHGNAGGGIGSITRFTLDGTGALRAGTPLTGNSLEAVHGLAFHPGTGELFAANLNGTFSRFTFDATGTPIANGTFASGHASNQALTFSPSGELFTTHSSAIVQRFTVDTVTGAVTPSGSFTVDGAIRLHGLAFNAQGELFIADLDMNRVSRYTFVNGNPVFNGSLDVADGPVGVAFSSSGELFVSSHFGGRLTRFLFDAAGTAVPNGVTTTPEPLGGLALITPTDVFGETASFTGSLLAVGHTQPGSGAGNNGNPLLTFSFNGTGELTRLGDIQACVVHDPVYAAFNGSGELFVSNRHGNAGGGAGSISRFTLGSDGTFKAGAPFSGNALEAVHGLAFHPATGELFAANWLSGYISRFLFDASGSPVANGSFFTGYSNQGLVFSAAGELFTTHSGSLVQRFAIDAATGAVTPAGSFSVDGSGRLHGLAFSQHGHLFIADLDGNAVHRYRFDNGVPVFVESISVAGGPVGVAFSSTGELFVSSHFEGRITRFLFDGNGALVPNGITTTSAPLGGLAIMNTLLVNQPPTANAGTDQAIHAGGTVTLDGSASFDDNTAPSGLQYAWTLTPPAGSAATLTGATTATPSFVADVPGSFVAQLVVTDAAGASSAPDTVTVSSVNLPPDADAGPDQTVTAGATVALNGTGSSDADGDQLSYAWTLLYPQGSTATLSGVNTATPTFIADVPGQYVVRLVVSDGFSASLMDEVLVQANAPGGSAENALQQADDVLEALPTSAFVAPGHRQALRNFIAQALAAIQSGNIALARNKIEAAMARVDGCALRGQPDTQGPGMDWINNCGAQGQVYPLLDAALDGL